MILRRRLPSRISSSSFAPPVPPDEYHSSDEEGADRYTHPNGDLGSRRQPGLRRGGSDEDNRVRLDKRVAGVSLVSLSADSARVRIDGPRGAGVVFCCQ